MSQFSITFNIETLEKIVFHPHEILKDYNQFWEKERPMILTKRWADSVHKEVDYNIWKKKLLDWAELSEAERVDHKIYKTAINIIKSKEKFLDEAIPHIKSFLPKEAELDVPVDFTAFIPCNAFAWEDVVVNVADPYWNFDPVRILNMIIHEVFHGGHSWYRQYYPKGSYGSEALFIILRSLQGEGICNYVSYTGQKIFPVPDERDYIMLEKPEEVKNALDRINLIFSRVNVDSEEKLRDLGWDLGVKNRAYYVLGSYMWQTIDQKLGRAVLKRILSIDFTTFIYIYNTLVDSSLRVNLPNIIFTPDEIIQPKVTFQPIVRENLFDVMNLEVKPEQKNFVAPNARSIALASYSENVYFKAIYVDDTPVGFIMLADPGRFGTSPERYFLWRFMIDQKYQGLGYGKVALDLLCKYVKTRPNAEYLYGSYHPEKNGPGKFYKHYGFEDIDEMWGDEQVMRFKL